MPVSANASANASATPCTSGELLPGDLVLAAYNPQKGLRLVVSAIPGEDGLVKFNFLCSNALFFSSAAPASACVWRLVARR